jgi:hypothetical protein
METDTALLKGQTTVIENTTDLCLQIGNHFLVLYAQYLAWQYAIPVIHQLYIVAIIGAHLV